MDTQAVTLELPTPVYHAAQRMSEQTHQSVEQVLQTTLTQALLPLTETPADERDAGLAAEMEANNREYERLRPELERDHWGRWVVIAFGKLQGIGDSLEEVDQLAPTARCRIITQVGEDRPKEIELGWSLSFVN